MIFKPSWIMFKQLLTNFTKDRIASQSAALAYYTLFSLAPILLICISIVGVVFGEEAAQGQILAQIGGLIGHESALQIQLIIEGANKPDAALWAKIISVLVLVFSSSGVFSEIQAGLNFIWGVKADPTKGWLSVIKDRFFSFIMVLGAAFLLLISLILSAVLASFSDLISHFMGTNVLFELIISDVVSFFIVTLLFALMFKVLPDVKISWHEVWFGALFTSTLFSLGKILIGFYLNKFEVGSVFGAAGSLIIILVWVYYSAQIFFIGAEITKLFSLQKGSKVIPIRNAIKINQKQHFNVHKFE